MPRAGLQDNYRRYENTVNTWKYTRQTKKEKSNYNSNVNDTNLKSFLYKKTLGSSWTTLTEKRNFNKIFS